MTQETEDAATQAARLARLANAATGKSKIREELDRKAGIFKRTFLTKDGEQALQMLEDAFNDDDLFNADPHRTAYNLGRRDVVMYIKQLIKFEVD